MSCQEAADSESFLSDDEFSRFFQIHLPSSIRQMALQERLHIQTMALRDWLDKSHSPTSANDGEALTFVLDGVKQPGEVPRGIGSTDFGH